MVIFGYATYALGNIDGNRTAGYTYGYDQLNRLVAMDRHIIDNPKSWDNGSIIKAYGERTSYDANGNIPKYRRNGADDAAGGMPLEMDDMAYGYNVDNDGRLVDNKLRHVKDAVADGNYPTDIDNQEDDNYAYDKIGNLIKDTKGNITNATWTVYGKLASVVKTTGTVTYSYDASGNRISKTVNGITTFYTKDAQGNVMGIYESSSTAYNWKEQDLYGSSRLGILTPKISITGTGNSPFFNDAVNDHAEDAGNRLYDLTNHLGNVMVTVSDVKLNPSEGVYLADIVSSQDYYAFGSTLPGRTFGTPGRYGFNGQEHSTEIGDDSYTAEFWEYDSRIGRRWNTDPIRKEYESPYATFGNNPIRYVDPKGKDTALYTSNAGILVGTKKGGDPKRTPIWVVDETAKNYNKKNPWATATPLTYIVGKDSKAKGISGTSFRDNHPLKNIGTKYGVQVYKEDLLDLTGEFNNLLKQGLPEFDAIKNMNDNNGGFGRSPKQRAFQKMVTDDGKWDLKSRITADGTPSYAAVVIGEWSFANGTLRRYDDYGNISYGVFGKAALFSDADLFRGSELNQKWKDFLGKTSGNGDEDRDIYMIFTGIYNYNNYIKK